MKLKCTLVKAGEPTINGRVYSEEALQKAVDCFKEREQPMFGELAPNNYGTEVSLENASHEVLNIELGSDGFLEAEISPLDTDNGHIIQDMGENNLQISPRFIGEVDQNNMVDVQGLVTFDVLLANPEQQGDK